VPPVPTPTPQHLTTTATDRLAHHPHMCHPLTTPTPAAPATLPTPVPTPVHSQRTNIALQCACEPSEKARAKSE